MKNSIPLWVEFLGMGNGAWGMGKKFPAAFNKVIVNAE
jgi:hypothetical protein